VSAGPIKVLVFQNRFRVGGGERQTILHLATLDRRRWEPVVKVLKLDGEHLDDLARLGIHPESLGVCKMLRPATAWRVARLAGELRRGRVALVHAQDFYTNLLGTLAARLAGLPVAVTRVDLMHHLDPVRRRALRVASRHADRVVVNALAIRDVCLAEGVRPERIAVVRNGIDLSAFDAAAAAASSLPLPGGGPGRGSGLLVQVANMHHPVKGHEDLLHAFRIVLQEVPSARLLLVGGGERRPLLERLSRELGVSDRVDFTGQRLDVPALLVRAGVVVSASHAEGLSNAVLEGMAARRPLVATAVGGTPELVKDGETGFLVPPRAHEVLAARIVSLLRDPALASRMGEAGRALAQREFSVEQMRRSYDALYASLTARRGSGRRLDAAA
jgi:L-malate glycosyltransferase